jgi:pyrimidine deaminase RibD-like protein
MDQVDSLDACLLGSIKHLFENWYGETTGIVSCALKDDNQIVYATSIRKDNAWLHAERNTYLKFKALHGEPSANAVFISTLSPCVKDFGHRADAACAELIKNLGVKRIHFGALDTSHVNSLAAYEQMGFVPSITKHGDISIVCNNLMNLFTRYGSRINKELLNIKQEIGYRYKRDSHSKSPLTFKKL